MHADDATLRLPDAPRSQDGFEVKAWSEAVEMGTYEPGQPMEYPAYLSRRVYQGSSGAVYPMPFHESISSTRETRSWEAVHLENEFVRLMILPELGGRIHVGFDKTADYDFFYRNNVIKPALVGLTGPWLAGGVEFNWPQHHRPATYLPTRVEIEHDEDGSVTVWCSDHDPFARMKGMHGVRLRPGSSVVEVRARLTNRSENVQTFLWWANVAAAVNDDYQSFFPTDATRVADHAKRAVTSFPVVDGSYYGIDYGSRAPSVESSATWVTAAPDRDGFVPPPREHGSDRLDWYHNIPVPTSYMIVGSDDDFFGGYDHGKQAGFVHWADHAIAPGKKQWTWGDAPFGHAWDDNLSDGDGPYVELMAGVFTDNQPDFSFLAPGETKAFSQYWFPIQGIGPAHQATRDVAVRLDVSPDEDETTVRIAVASATRLLGATITLSLPDGKFLWHTSGDLAPGKPLVVRTKLLGNHDAKSLTLTVAHDKNALLSWTPRALKGDDDDDDMITATEPPAPADIQSVDELYMTGVHLMQYRHATRRPEPYWEEALVRDPGDARCHTALGARSYDSGDYARAELHLLSAKARLTHRNPNPRDGEAHFRLGQTLRRLGRPTEALDAFATASWLSTWAVPSGIERARILAKQTTPQSDAQALEMLRAVLSQAPESLQARSITAVLLRRSDRDVDHAEADEILLGSLAIDPLDEWTLFLAGRKSSSDAQVLLDVALEMVSLGEWSGVLELLDLAEDADGKRALGATAAGPLLDYHRAEALDAVGRHDEATHARASARTRDARWCFPVRLDDVDALERQRQADPLDPRAAALLGHWLYAHGRQAEALSAWQESADIDPSDAVVQRNLGLARFDIEHDQAASKAAYERALSLKPNDARLWFERDQLAKKSGESPEARVARLQHDANIVAIRDDLSVEYADLLTLTGDPAAARNFIAGRQFHPWEGGEGLVLAAWTRANLALARTARTSGHMEEALDRVNDTLVPPKNLGEARHPLQNAADIYLEQGDVFAAAGRIDEAQCAWSEAASVTGDFRGMAVAEYSDLTYFTVLALRRLGRVEEARALRDDLDGYLERTRNDRASVDYFATSLPTLLLFDEDPSEIQRRERLVLFAQVALLDADADTASQLLDQLLVEDPSHPLARLLVDDLTTATIEETTR